MLMDQKAKDRVPVRHRRAHRQDPQAQQGQTQAQVPVTPNSAAWAWTAVVFSPCM